MQVFFSHYYNNFWKVSIVLFEYTISRFEKLVLDFKLSFTNMNLAMQQVIANLTNKQPANYAKLDRKFEFIQLIIEALIESSLAALSKSKPF